MDTSELRRLLEAATPGEWENWPDLGVTVGPDGVTIQTCGTGFHGECAEELKANAALIPAMRNALPAILDRLAALEDVAFQFGALGRYLRDIPHPTASAMWQIVERQALHAAALARLDGEASDE